jgi:hypothetical protein
MKILKIGETKNTSFYISMSYSPKHTSDLSYCMW